MQRIVFNICAFITIIIAIGSLVEIVLSFKKWIDEEIVKGKEKRDEVTK